MALTTGYDDTNFVMELTTGCNGSQQDMMAFTKDVMVQYSTTNSPSSADVFFKETNEGLGTPAFTDSESIRDNQSSDRGCIQSVTTPSWHVAATRSRGCATSRLGKHRPT